VRQKVAPEVVRCFFSSRLEFLFKILQFQLAKPTYNCRVKCDSIKKGRSDRLFNMTTHGFFSIKMFLSNDTATF